MDLTLDETGDDRPVCGWRYADDTVCREPRVTRRCEEHERLQYRTCVGCSGEACRNCGPMCTSPVCNECNHHPDGTHSSAPLAPFAQQQTVNPVSKIRRQMIGTIADSLRSAAIRGQLSFPDEAQINVVASNVLDDMAIESLKTLIDGLAAAQGAQSP